MGLLVAGFYRDNEIEPQLGVLKCGNELFASVKWPDTSNIPVWSLVGGKT